MGVGGVVITDGRALLIRRAGPPLQGEWSIPGGLLELGESLNQGVRRELAEETGLEVRVLDLIEVFERISLDGEGKPKYHFVVLDYLCEPVRGDARAGSDDTIRACDIHGEVVPTAIVDVTLAHDGYGRGEKGCCDSGDKEISSPHPSLHCIMKVGRQSSTDDPCRHRKGTYGSLVEPSGFARVGVQHKMKTTS